MTKIKPTTGRFKVTKPNPQVAGNDQRQSKPRADEGDHQAVTEISPRNVCDDPDGVPQSQLSQSESLLQLFGEQSPATVSPAVRLCAVQCLRGWQTQASTQPFLVEQDASFIPKSGKRTYGLEYF